MMDRRLGLLLLVLWSALTSALPSVDERMKRLTEDADGYSVATVHTDTDLDLPLTRRDMLAHAEHAADKTLTVRMASGEELRMSLVRRRHVNTSGMHVIEYTKAGRRDVSNEVQVRDCFLDGPLTDGSGHASVAMCDGELMGSVTTKHQRLFEIVPLPAAKRAEDDVMQVLVTWKRQAELHFGDAVKVAAEDAFDNDVTSNETSSSEEDNLYSDEASEEKHGSKDVEIEIGSYLDKFYIDACAKELNTNSNQDLVDLQIFKWSAAAAILMTPKLLERHSDASCGHHHEG
jgi:hypothetical protein